MRATRFSELQRRHRELRDASAKQALFANEVEIFLEEIGQYLKAAIVEPDVDHSLKDRSEMSEWVQSWSDYVFTRRGSYPPEDQVAEWSNLLALTRDTVESVTIEGGEATLTWKSGSVTSTPYLAPKPHSRLIPGKDDLLASLKQQLLDHSILALFGNSGVGKTTIARHIAADKKVLSLFPDGVLFAALGSSTFDDSPSESSWAQLKSYEILGTWCHAMGLPDAEIAALTSWEQRRDALRSQIGSKRVLIVLDDVCEPQRALDLKCGGINTAYLITAYTEAVARAFVGEEAVLDREFVEITAPTVSDRVRYFLDEFPKEVAGQESSLRELCSLPGLTAATIQLIGKALEHTVRTDLRWWCDQLRSVSPESDKSASDEVLRRVLRIILDAVDDEDRDLLWVLSHLPPRPSHFSTQAAVTISGDEGRVERLIKCGLLTQHSETRVMVHRPIRALLWENFSPGPDEFVGGHRSVVRFYADYVLQNADNYFQLCRDHLNIVTAFNLAGVLDADPETGHLVVDAAHAHHRFALAKGLYDLTRDNLGKGLRIATALRYARGECLLRLDLGEVLEKCGHSFAAEVHLGKALTLSRELQSSELECRALERLGNVALGGGYYLQAEEFLRGAETVVGNDSIAHARILLRLAVLYTNWGRDDQASSCNASALDLIQSLQEAQPETATEVVELHCSALLNAGVLAFHHQRHHEAQALDLRALNLARAIPALELETAVLQALGGVAMENKEHAQAERHLSQALVLAKQLGHRWYVGLIQKEMGELYLRLQKPELAATAFRSCEYIGRYLGSTEEPNEQDLRFIEPAAPDLVAFALFGRARVAATQNRNEEALSLAEDALRIAERLEHRIRIQIREWLTRRQEIVVLLTPAFR